MSMADAVIGLKAFKEVDERMEQLWHNLDAAVFLPRMNSTMKSLPKIQASENTLELDGRADRSTGALLTDLEKAFTLIAQKLPPELLQSLCGFMMGDIIPRLIEAWLVPAVPSSLDDLASFEQMIEEAGHLCVVLEEHGFTGFGELRAWVDNAPETWLRTSRDSALAAIRSKLTIGIGQPKKVEKIEKHMVSLSEGRELATTGAGAAAETNEWDADWGDAWDADEQADNQASEPKAASGPKKAPEVTAAEDDGADAWGWDDDGAEATDESEDTAKKSQDDDEDDSAAAWGWGDEDTTQEPEPQPVPKSKAPSQIAETTQPTEETRELIFKESYSISSMPEPVLELIFAILEDAAILTRGKNEHGRVAATAPGLFSVPTSVLALFRALAPHYYAPQGGGNMYADYNVRR
jgi:protein transport protein DSL1/ZW10